MISAKFKAQKTFDLSTCKNVVGYWIKNFISRDTRYNAIYDFMLPLEDYYNNHPLLGKDIFEWIISDNPDLLTIDSAYRNDIHHLCHEEDLTLSQHIKAGSPKNDIEYNEFNLHAQVLYTRDVYEKYPFIFAHEYRVRFNVESKKFVHVGDLIMWNGGDEYLIVEAKVAKSRYDKVISQAHKYRCFFKSKYPLAKVECAIMTDKGFEFLSPETDEFYFNVKNEDKILNLSIGKLKFSYVDFSDDIYNLKDRNIISSNDVYMTSKYSYLRDRNIPLLSNIDIVNRHNELAKEEENSIETLDFKVLIGDVVILPPIPNDLLCLINPFNRLVYGNADISNNGIEEITLSLSDYERFRYVPTKIGFDIGCLAHVFSVSSKQIVVSLELCFPREFSFLYDVCISNNQDGKSIFLFSTLHVQSGTKCYGKSVKRQTSRVYAPLIFELYRNKCWGFYSHSFSVTPGKILTGYANVYKDFRIVTTGSSSSQQRARLFSPVGVFESKRDKRIDAINDVIAMCLDLMLNYCPSYFSNILNSLL